MEQTVKQLWGGRRKSRLPLALKPELKTTEGIGPDFKMSFHTGMGSVQENTTEFDVISNLTQEANVNYDGNLKNPASEAQGVIKKMSVNIQITAYSYIDNYGACIISTGSTPSNSGGRGLHSNRL